MTQILPRQLLLSLPLTLIVFAHASAQQAAQPKLPGQYKRVHQKTLKLILSDKVEQAVEQLERVLEKLPDDAESHYMLALARSRQGRGEQAAKHMEKALANGLDEGRFLAGTKTGLDQLRHQEPLRGKLQQLKHEPAHGPMLGCISGSSVKVWVRTYQAAKVSVAARPAASPQAEPIVSDEAASNNASDFTAVVSLQGLEPRTEYRYEIRIDGKPGKSTYTFKTLATVHEPIKFRLAFGGGAGFVPPHEYVWDTIRKQDPDVLLLLGDNVYSDDPTTPAMQHYCYYRRQSRPEFRRLVAETPVFSIWDDHDFGTNDCSGGPEINQPPWKVPVYNVFRNNWVNPYYGGGDRQPGCYYDVYLGDIHFIMLDGRFYRNHKPDDRGHPSMLGPVQRTWLLKTLKGSRGKLIVLCSPVPWVYRAKGDSKDTWNGFKHEREQIFDFLAEHKIEGVVLMSADRHRSDLWKIERESGYPLYEFNSSRLTNQHVHNTMKEAIFSYNKKQSFGTVDFDTTVADPEVTYRVVTIDGEEVHRFSLRRSALTHRRSRC